MRPTLRARRPSDERNAYGPRPGGHLSPAPRSSPFRRSTPLRRRAIASLPCSRSPTVRAVAVVTVAASPVKERALELGIPVLQPATLKCGEAVRAIAALAPDVMVVVAYGLLLPPEVLAVPRLGCLNIHASLLPRWRGAAPVARAILAGDERTGVCIMRMEAGLDTGPGDARARSRDWHARVRRRARGRGWRRRAAQRLPRRSMPSPTDAPASWRRTRRARPTRQSSPRPRRASTGARRRRARAPRARAESAAGRRDDARRRAASHSRGGSRVAPRRARCRAPSWSAGADGIVVMAGEGALALRRLQLPGRRAVSARELANARALVGKVLA